MTRKLLIMRLGVGQPYDETTTPWTGHGRRVTVGGSLFGEFLMTPSAGSLVVVDGRQGYVHCQWHGVEHGNVVVWVEPLRL